MTISGIGCTKHSPLHHGSPSAAYRDFCLVCSRRVRIICSLRYAYTVCIHTHAKRSHLHVKVPVVHVRVSSADYGNIIITQHALTNYFF